MADWSLYQHEKELAEERRKVMESNLPQESKDLILAFDRACLALGRSIPRRKKMITHLRIIARDLLPVSLDKATKPAVQEAVARIEARTDWALYTKRDYKIVLRRFFKWFVYREDWSSKIEYPDMVSWIRPALKRKDRCRVKASDLLTPDETSRMIEAAQNPRNRAFVAILYELGARISEVGTMHVGDVTRDEHSLLLDVEGRTGKRTVRLVLFASHLVTWLNLHPARNNPRMPLWPALRPGTYLAPLRYRELNAMTKDAASRAGITKRIYPHLFRHSRSTHLLATGMMNEAQAKVFFGWVPDSGMLSTYAHLIAKDANDAVLRMYGIEKKGQGDDLRARGCGMCRTPNTQTAAFCYRCGYALSLQGAEEAHERTRVSEDRMMRFLQSSQARELFKQWARSEDDTSSTRIGTPERVAQSQAPSEEGDRQRKKAA